MYLIVDGINELSILKFRNYPSILFIKSKIRNPVFFSFNEVSFSVIEKEVRSLNMKNVGTFKNIPPNIFKASVESY